MQKAGTWNTDMIREIVEAASSPCFVNTNNGMWKNR